MIKHQLNVHSVSITVTHCQNLFDSHILSDSFLAKLQKDSVKFWYKKFRKAVIYVANICIDVFNVKFLIIFRHCPFYKP